jgi:uncharacterized membrane protein HdeD (DUF308 family)
MATIVYNRRLRWMAVLKGLILIILGIVALINPAAALMTFAMYLGFAMLFTGLILVFSSVINNKVRAWGWALAEGILDLFFGILVITYPFMTAVLLPVMVGFWIFFGGILQMATSIAYRKLISGWWVGIAYGLIAITFSLFILYMPLFSSLIFIFTLGVFVILFGIYYIITAITHKRIAY